MINNVKQYYKDLLKKNGPTLAAVQHNSREAQNKRFEILFNIDKGMKSLIDVGCGLGDIISRIHADNRYGYDISNEVLKAAKFKNKKDINFYCICLCIFLYNLKYKV